MILYSHSPPLFLLFDKLLVCVDDLSVRFGVILYDLPARDEFEHWSTLVLDIKYLLIVRDYCCKVKTSVWFMMLSVLFLRSIHKQIRVESIKVYISLSLSQSRHSKVDDLTM